MTPLSSACIRLHPDDDVAVAKSPLKAGTPLVKQATDAFTSHFAAPLRTR